MANTARRTARFGDVLRQDEAVESGASVLGLEHLLLGLAGELRDHDPGSPPVRSVLGRVDRLRAAAAALPPTGSDVDRADDPVRHPPFSAEAAEAEAAAGRLADRDREVGIGTGHLLRALLADPAPRTDELLRTLPGVGVDRRRALAELRVTDTSDRPYAVVGPVMAQLGVLVGMLSAQARRLDEIERRLGDR